MTGLESLREHHLADARAQAASRVAEARAASQAMLEKAKADAAALTRQAEEEGQTSAEQDTGRDWIAARRRARAIRLAAQRSVYENLRAEAARAVESEPRCADLLRSVADAARLRLGPGAVVSVDRRGVRAARKATHVRWTIEEAVDGALSQLGPQVEELWR
jgi:vacuolar-type H+-ATPase subunit E/Vma4